MVVLEDVVKRLKHFKYSVTEADYEMLEFELNKTLNYVRNYCNITEIPEILDPRIIDRVCGYFLYTKRNTTSSSDPDNNFNTDFNYDAAIKEIREGDTTIKYAIGDDSNSPDNRYDSFIKSLERGFDKWITPHRRLRW